QHFGPALTVGVEEELWILDGDTLELVPGVQQLIAGVEGRTLPGTLKTELHASVVEVTNEVAGSPDEAVDRVAVLREAAAEAARANGLDAVDCLVDRVAVLREAAAEAARANGLVVAAAGSHPTSRPEEQEIAPEERYREFVEYA